MAEIYIVGVYIDVGGSEPYVWDGDFLKFIIHYLSPIASNTSINNTSFLKHDQQDATLYNTLYYCQRSTCFERFFRSSSGAQICTCNISICQTRLLLSLAWKSPNSSTLAITVNKFDKYLMLHIQF